MFKTDGMKPAAILAAEKAAGNEAATYLQAWRAKRAMEAEAENTGWIDPGRYASPEPPSKPARHDSTPPRPVPSPPAPRVKFIEEMRQKSREFFRQNRENEEAHFEYCLHHLRTHKRGLPEIHQDKYMQHPELAMFVNKLVPRRFRRENGDSDARAGDGGRESDRDTGAEDGDSERDGGIGGGGGDGD